MVTTISDGAALFPNHFSDIYLIAYAGSFRLFFRRRECGLISPDPGQERSDERMRHPSRGKPEKRGLRQQEPRRLWGRLKTKTGSGSKDCMRISVSAASNGRIPSRKTPRTVLLSRDDMNPEKKPGWPQPLRVPERPG